MSSENAWIYRTRPACWMEVSDEDAADFLQSQFSADLRGSGPRAVAGLWLDHRGKVQGDSIVGTTNGAVFQVFAESFAADALQAKLERHIVTDEVILEDATAEVEALLVSDFESAALLWKNLFGEMPTPGIAFSTSEGGWALFPKSGGVPACFVGSSTWIETLVKGAEAAGFASLSPTDYLGRRVTQRRLLLPGESNGEDTPIELGLESLCSPSKGCFLGQEVVARQHRLGRRTRSLAAVRGSGAPPEFPSVLTQEGSEVGELRTATTAGGDWVGLALLKSRLLEAPGTVVLACGSARVEVLSDG